MLRSWPAHSGPRRRRRWRPGAARAWQRRGRRSGPWCRCRARRPRPSGAPCGLSATTVGTGRWLSSPLVLTPSPQRRCSVCPVSASQPQLSREHPVADCKRRGWRTSVVAARVLPRVNAAMHADRGCLRVLLHSSVHYAACPPHSSAGAQADPGGCRHARCSSYCKAGKRCRVVGARSEPDTHTHTHTRTGTFAKVPSHLCFCNLLVLRMQKAKLGSGGGLGCRRSFIHFEAPQQLYRGPLAWLWKRNRQ